MKITAQDLKEMGLVDEVIPEPPGGAHVSHDALFKNVDGVLSAQLEELRGLDSEALADGRYRKFRDMGRLGKEFLEVVE
jgi:acetyl-CoA carboxylase carboxyl transferase subunit alpha